MLSSLDRQSDLDNLTRPGLLSPLFTFRRRQTHIRRPLLPTDHPHRGQERHGLFRGGDIRAGGLCPQVRQGGGGHRHRQRLQHGARRLLLLSRRQPGMYSLLTSYKKTQVIIGAKLCKFAIHRGNSVDLWHSVSAWRGRSSPGWWA